MLDINVYKVEPKISEKDNKIFHEVSKMENGLKPERIEIQVRNIREKDKKLDSDTKRIVDSMNLSVNAEIKESCLTGNWTKCIELLDNYLCKGSTEHKQLQIIKRQRREYRFMDLSAHGIQEKGFISEKSDLPLHAAERGFTDVIQVLLDNGLPINKGYGGYNSTMLHYATYYGYANLVNLLISQGADINVKELSGSTPLHWAVINGHLNVAKILIDNNADINATDIDNWTPLHGATFCEHLHIVRLLVNKGCDKSVVNNEGNTAMSIAEQKELTEILDILSERYRNSTHLKNNNTEIVNILCEE